MLLNSGPVGREVADDGSDKPKTEYEQMLWKMHHDARWLKEISLGKRVGFYRFSENIGSGNFSHVKLGMHLLTRDKVAVKIIDKTKLEVKTRKMINQEIKTMEAVHHPNIIRLFEVMDTYRKMYLVMEYAPGGELFTRISTAGPLPDTTAKLFFLQVAQAVHHMHKLGYVHRDIKAENVFISSYNAVKLGDFGFSAHLQDEPDKKLNTFCGSPPYAAPELFRDDSYTGRHVDVWALGVLLYFMLTASMPFRASTVAELKSCILAGKFTVPDNVPPQCRYIIDNTLIQNGAERLALSEIIANEWLRMPKSNPTRLRKNSLMLLAKKLRRNRAPSTDDRRLSLLKDFELKRIPEIIKNNKTNDITSISLRPSADKDAESTRIKDYVMKKNQYSKGKSFDMSLLPSTRPEKILHSRDGMPSELGRFVMFPTAEVDLENVCLLERMARERLARLGITTELLLDNLANESRNAVIGAYRCVVNRILEEQYMWESLNDPHSLIQLSTKREQSPSNRNKQCFRSKLANVCIIL